MVKGKIRSICENDRQIKREINQKIIHMLRKEIANIEKNHKFKRKKNTGSGVSTKNRINFIVLR